MQSIESSTNAISLGHHSDDHQLPVHSHQTCHQRNSSGQRPSFSRPSCQQHASSTNLRGRDHCPCSHCCTNLQHSSISCSSRHRTCLRGPTSNSPNLRQQHHFSLLTTRHCCPSPIQHRWHSWHRHPCQANDTIYRCCQQGGCVKRQPCCSHRSRCLPPVDCIYGSVELVMTLQFFSDVRLWTTIETYGVRWVIPSKYWLWFSIFDVACHRHAVTLLFG